MLEVEVHRFNGLQECMQVGRVGTLKVFPSFPSPSPWHSDQLNTTLEVSSSPPSSRQGQIQLWCRQREIIPEFAYKSFLGLARCEGNVVPTGQEGGYAPDFHEAEMFSYAGETAFHDGGG